LLHVHIIHPNSISLTKTFITIDLICCDGCPHVYHPGCIGVKDAKALPEQWFCESCSEEQSSTTSTTKCANKRRKKGKDNTAASNNKNNDKNNDEDGDDDEVAKAVSKESDEDEQSTPGDSNWNSDETTNELVTLTLEKQVGSLEETIYNAARSILHKTFDKKVEAFTDKVNSLNGEIKLLMDLEDVLNRAESSGLNVPSINNLDIDKNKKQLAVDLRTKKGKLDEAEAALKAAKESLGINDHNWNECALKLQSILTIRNRNDKVLFSLGIDNNNDVDDDETVDDSQTATLINDVERESEKFITTFVKSFKSQLESSKKDVVNKQYSTELRRTVYPLWIERLHAGHNLHTANELKELQDDRRDNYPGGKEKFDEKFSATITTLEEDCSRMKEEYDKAESVYETAEKRLATDAKALDETLREMLKITIGSNVTIQPALRDFEDCPLPGVASVADDDSDEDDDDNNFDNTGDAVRVK